MARALELRVLDPAEVLLEAGDVQWVHLRLADGTGITIYPGHAPLLAETVSAPLHYADRVSEHVLNVEAGILQVSRDEVAVFTSGRSEVKAAPRPSAVSEERRFERLARELLAKLERETSSLLGGALNLGDEEA